LSPYRLVFLIAVVAVLAGSAVYGVTWWQDERRADRSRPWFAAYVDVTATPVQAFESPSGPVDRYAVLGFVVAAAPADCTASWGAYYTLPEAQTSLDLDRRIARLKQAGGDVVLSFGGQANAELALACASVDALTEQYEQAVDRYRPAALDLDIEGDALADRASRERRVEAIKRLLAGRDEPLPVWLTLPVGTDGLTADGVAVVDEFLAAGVPIAGVNAMTMDFTGITDSAAAAVAALKATHRQVRAIYADREQSLGDRTAWRMVGATPMIGQNDVPGEVFTLDDARRLREFAAEVNLGRMSMWSANRDRSCATAYVDLSVVSDSCSGVDQGDQRFGDILGEGFTGAPDGAPEATSPAPTVRPEDITDDPATSPYPIWNADASYPAGTRVVWRHDVYAAKWWTTHDQPDDPSVAPADNPWRLIGPVLPGETPVPTLSLPEGFYPAWDATTIYQRGRRVMFDGVAYEAKWWSQGDNPAAGQADPGASPWRALTQDEIAKLLAENR
jgi:chitinase